MIKFQRSFTTPDEIQTVQATVITYMQSIGYQLKKDDNGLRFRRGSSFGVFYSSKAKNLKTDCQVVLKRLNTYQTEVSLFFDVQVAESYDTDRNRKQWLAEMDGLVKASGGTVDPNSPVNIQAAKKFGFTTGQVGREEASSESHFRVLDICKIVGLFDESYSLRQELMV